MSATQSHMEKRVEETHKAEWHNYAGVGSLVSIILPVLSEFEGVGESLFYAVGGTSAVSVFAMLMKIGRVSALASDIAVEHKEILVEDKKVEIKERQEFNERQFEKYGHYKLSP